MTPRPGETWQTPCGLAEVLEQVGPTFLVRLLQMPKGIDASRVLVTRDFLRERET